MGTSDLDRYSISKINETTFMLTDADTLQTWQIEILQNKCKETDEEDSKDEADNKPN